MVEINVFYATTTKKRRGKWGKDVMIRDKYKKQRNARWLHDDRTMITNSEQKQR